MSLYSPNQNFYPILIFLAAVVLCFVNLGGHSIFILDEAKNAEAAREMWESGNYIVPFFNEELRTDKPPLHYWFMLVAFKFFGVNAFAARFFSAFFGVMTILSTYHFTQKFLNRRIAAISGFVLCASFFFIQEFHLAVPDPYLIFFVSFSLFSFYDFYKFGTRSSWLYLYLTLGLGVLAKGPVALALPGLIILIFILWKKELNKTFFQEFKPFLGGLITLAIAAPWYWKVHQLTGGAYTKGFFLEHNFSRFGNEMEGHGGWFFITWIFVILGLLPFSFYIIQTFSQTWKNKKTHDFILFSLIVAIVFIGFFSISSTKLPNYTMPSYPFIAILTAFYLNRVIEGKTSVKYYKISLWVLFGVAVLIPVAGYIVLTEVETGMYAHRYFSILLLILPFGVGLALFYLKKRKITESIIATGLTFMFFTLELFQFIYPRLITETPSIQAAEIISKETPALLYRGYDPSLMFNLQRTFPVSNEKEKTLEILENNPETLIITKEKFYRSDWEDVDTELLMLKKAPFENYAVAIFKLKE